MEECLAGPRALDQNSWLAGGPQRAVKTIKFLSKELAMKTSLLTALVVIGVLLQAAVVPTVNNVLTGTAANQHQTTMQTAGAAQMNNAVGAGLNGCWQYKGADGSTYGMCCVDLWLFAVCVTVNMTAVGNLVNSIF